MKFTQLAFTFMLVSSGVVVAEDVKIVGSIRQSIEIPSDARMLGSQPMTKEIALLKIELSEHARQTLASRVARAAKTEATFHSAGVPKKVQLGMGSVPVLDQGAHGSCVTFANTAAIDAVINKGDYVSQLCPLQLGIELEKEAYTMSGWDGSLGPVVLNQLSLFGIVSKAQQKANGCGGLTEYPRAGNTPTSGMTASEYHQISEALDPKVVAWSSVFDVFQVFDDKMDMNNALTAVKAVLNAGDRLTFGVLFPDIDQGTAGAVGKYHNTNDSWVLTPEIAQDMNNASELAGHEMVITGYDDDASAVDGRGRSYKGLFTLRNSWGGSAGDKGNFYMSYEYFKALVIEAQRIRHITP